MHSSAYCNNEKRWLKGETLLQERHLGILGYKVIQLCYREWNSMYMNLPGAKLNHLKCMLGIE